MTINKKAPVIQQDSIFINADAGYEIAEIGKKYRLNLMYGLNYIEEFYLNYPSIGQGGQRYTIPTQFIHNVGVTLSSVDDRYNFTLESRNFTDALAYDNFALQKPGRAFYIKLRYFIQ